MQSSQRVAPAMPSAINSLVLTSSAFGVSAACARPVKAFIASGASPRKVRMTPLILLVWFCQSVMGRFSSTNIHDAEYDFGSRDIDADQKQTGRLLPCRPFRPQQEQKQRAPGHLILVPEGQAHRLLRIDVILRQVGIDEPLPAAAADHLRPFENHHRVMT